MICPFEECRKETTLPLTSMTHLIVAVDDGNRTHIHGPYQGEEGKAWIMRMLVDVARFIDVDLYELADKEKEFYGDQPPRGVTVQ